MCVRALCARDRVRDDVSVSQGAAVRGVGASLFGPAKTAPGSEISVTRDDAVVF